MATAIAISVSDAAAPTVPADVSAVPRLPRPDPRDKVAAVEREALKVALQAPQVAGSWVDALEPAAHLEDVARLLEAI